jgi:endonuclease/exonuclease/phosphatase family metal-dependent hydrolase
VVRLPLQFAGSKGQAKLTVMSYNVLNFFEPRAGVLGKPTKGVKALAEVILKENPDIVAVQEVQHGETLARFAKKHLNERYNAVCSPANNDGRGICVGFLYKKDLTLTNLTSYNQQNPGEAKVFLRDLLQATFEVPTPDGCKQEIIVLNSHYKSMRGGEAETTPQRIREAQATVDTIEALLAEDPKRNIIFMGDLNFKATTEYGQQVMDTLLSAQTPANQPALGEWFGDNPLPTHRYRKQDSKLDYIFATRPLLKDKLEARVSGQFGVKPWTLASDHLPPVGVMKTRCAHQVGDQATGTVIPVKFEGQPAAVAAGSRLSRWA